MSDRPVTVIYHGGCRDGFCAAWLFHHAFPVAEFVAAQYDDAPPDVTGKRVFIADFSYRRDVMKTLICAASSVVVLDHHRTAQADLDGLVEECNDLYRATLDITFDMAKSGARLAWEYLYGNRLLPDWWLTTSESGYSLGVAPWLVDYTEDRDLWRHALPESREINAALRSYPLDFNKWDVMHNVYRSDSLGLSRLVPEGEAILRSEQAIVAQHVRHAKPIMIAGHTVPVVNATTLISEIAGELAKGQQFAACYFDDLDAGVRRWSLRSDANGLDVSIIANTFGGGGHVRAAGFETLILRPLRVAPSESKL